MRIITVSREYGSGGKELGKRLSEMLGFAYYDKEIIAAVAKELSMDEGFVERTTERGVSSPIPLHVSRSLTHFPSFSVNDSYLLVQLHKNVRKLAAKGDCVIIGRGADVILQEFNPFTLFIYADMPTKIRRCRANAAEDEKLSDQEWERKIRQADNARAKNYEMISSSTWGNMHNYHLCVNTSDMEINSIVPLLAEYAKAEFERKFA